MALYTRENPPRLLAQGDDIEFSYKGKIQRVRVYSDHLSQYGGSPSDWIWKTLGLYGKRHKFCAEVYGYPDSVQEYQNWPESHYNDMAALTRLTLILMGMLRNKEKKMIPAGEIINPKGTEELKRAKTFTFRNRNLQSEEMKLAICQIIGMDLRKVL